MAAQVQQLGNFEDNLIFLSYPDGSLKAIYDTYTRPSSQLFTSFGQGVTCGNRGLGRMDYHSCRFVFPAAYNRPNIVTMAVGARVFDANIEGVRVFENIDVFATAGARTALVRSATTTVSNGRLDIDFLHQSDDPLVNAIEIIGISTPCPDSS